LTHKPGAVRNRISGQGADLFWPDTKSRPLSANGYAPATATQSIEPQGLDSN